MGESACWLDRVCAVCGRVDDDLDDDRLCDTCAGARPGPPPQSAGRDDPGGDHPRLTDESASTRS